MKWFWRSAVALARWLWRLVTGRRNGAITEPHPQLIVEPAQAIALSVVELIHGESSPPAGDTVDLPTVCAVEAETATAEFELSGDNAGAVVTQPTDVVIAETNAAAIATVHIRGTTALRVIPAQSEAGPEGNSGTQATENLDSGFRRSLPSGQLREDDSAIVTTRQEVAAPVANLVPAEGAVFEAGTAAPDIESESKPETTAPAEAKPRPQIELPKDYVPSVESTHALYQISFDAFAGPLDLLLFLIRRHHLDIFDIPIAFICKEYLACLQAMEELNVDVAAEFMLMASELLHIKSRMLLPQPAEVEDEEELDPRAELVRRLLEYQKYRVAAEHMAELTRLNRDVFEHPADAIPPIEGQTPLKEVGVFALIEAFGQVIKRQKPEFMHRVALETVSVRRQMTDFVDQLHRQGSICFQDAIAKLQTRLQIVATFLAMLELTKLRLVGIYQSDTGMIYLQPRFERTEDAIGRIAGVEEQYL